MGVARTTLSPTTSATSFGAATPVGSLTFRDKALDKRVQSTAIDSLTITGARATITGRATVDGVPGVSFVVDVEDLGKAGADTFRLVIGDGFAIQLVSIARDRDHEHVHLLDDIRVVGPPRVATEMNVLRHPALRRNVRPRT